MVVHIRRQLLWANSVRPYFKLPKGKKERDVPLSSGLLAAIRAHEKQFPPITVTLPWEGPGNGGRKTATVRLLVTTQPGNRVNPSIYNNKTMKPALARAGLIAPRQDGANWGWEPSREKMHHRYRHTYASVQLLAGEDPISVSHWMGHASVDTTFRIYAHFIPDKGERGRTAVDAWLDSAHALEPTGRDLYKVEPLRFTEVQPLGTELAAFVCGGTSLYLAGARYGGAWRVGLQADAEAELLGEIRTEGGGDHDPDRALAAGLVWAREACALCGFEVESAENLSGKYPVEVRPYQALGRLLLTAKAQRLATVAVSP